MNLDKTNPWPGLAAFEEGDASFFFGREREVEELLRSIRRAVLTVLFGKSAVGKTSLLSAGLLPVLVSQGHYLPVYLQIIDRSETAAPLVPRVLDAVSKAAASAGIETPDPGDGPTLWEYFHRVGARFWSREHEIVTPVLVFDRFEDLLRLAREELPRGDEARAALLQFADLVECRAPEALRRRLDEAPDEAHMFDFARHVYRVVISLREDFLPELDDLRELIPSVRNRLRLRPMTGETALDAVLKAGGQLMASEVAEEIVRFVGSGPRPRTGTNGGRGKGPLKEIQVEPFLLSLFCRELNELRQRQSRSQISTDLIQSHAEDVLAHFFAKCMKGLPRRLRRFVEDRLLTDSGSCDSFALENLARERVTREQIDVLVERRMLRIEAGRAGRRVEIIHDVLAPIVAASRDRRNAQRQLRRVVGALLGLCVLFGVGTGIGLWARRQQNIAMKSLAKTRYYDGLYGLRDGRNQGGLAYLASSLKTAPTSTGTRTALFSTLIYTAWPLAIVRQADDVVSAAFVSRDGHVATAAVDGSVQLWDSTGIPIGTVQELRSDGLRAAAFASSGLRIAVVAADRQVRLWDAHAPSAIPLPAGGPVYSVAFSGDESRLAIATVDGALLWDVPNRIPVGERLAAGERVFAITLSFDGSRVVTADDSGTVQSWDANSGTAIAPPIRHTSSVYAVGLTSDGSRLVTGAEDGIVRLWNLPAGSLVAEWPAHIGRVRSATFSPNGACVLTASDDWTARVWDATNGRNIGPPRRHEDRVWSAAFSADGTRMVTASADHTARIWSAAPGAAAGMPLEHASSVRWAAFSPDGNRIVTAPEDGEVHVWDTRTAETQATLPHGTTVYAAAFSPDENLVATGAHDCGVRLWSLGKAAPRSRELGRHGATEGGGVRCAVRSVGFRPDGRRLVSASDDGNAIIWDTDSGAQIGKPLKHRRPVLSASFVGDSLILTSSRDGALIWDATTHEALSQKPLAHDVTVWFASISPDGRSVVTASDDCTAREWDWKRQRPVGEPLRHERGILGTTACTVRMASFSPDGSMIVTASVDGTARLWDARTGIRIGEPFSHEGTVWSAVFSPDGTKIVTASEDNTARVWEVSADAAIQAEDLVRLAEAVAGRSIAPDGTLRELDDRQERIAALQAEAAEQKAGRVSAFVQLTRWFFADPASRTLSPFSTKVVPADDARGRSLCANEQARSP